MFKHFFYKIITIVGLLAGLLGPQVATGTEFNLGQAPSVVQQDYETISVVTNQTPQVAIEVATGPNCDYQSSSRLDILLLQPCDMNLLATTAGHQPDVVVVKPKHDNIALSVYRGPEFTQSSQVESSTQQSILFALGNSLVFDTKQEKAHTFKLFEHRLFLSHELVALVSDNHRVVMRC